MRMRRMLTGSGGRKTEQALRIGLAMRQTTFHQPVKNAIEGDAVECQIAERLLDLVMAQCCRCNSEQQQDADACRRRPRARLANQQGDALSFGQPIE